MKISECVNEFIEMWILWLKENDIAIDKTQQASVRRKAAVRAEKLLNRRYWLIEKINEHFSEFEE
jgi:hypothetical protein